MFERMTELLSDHATVYLVQELTCFILECHDDFIAVCKNELTHVSNVTAGSFVHRGVNELLFPTDL